MKKRPVWISLSLKISLLFAALIFLVIGIFTLVLYFHFQKTLKASITQAVDSTITVNTNELQSLLERIETAVDLVYRNETIHYAGESDNAIARMIIHYEKDPQGNNLAQFKEEYDTDLSLFNNYFRTCFGSEEGEYSNLLFVDLQWPVHVFMSRVSSFEEKNGFASSLKVKEEEWYLKAQEQNGEIYWFSQEGKPANETMSNRLCMAKSLKYRYVEENVIREKELGVLVLSFDITAFSRHLDMQGLTADSGVCLTNRDGVVIYTTKYGTVGERLPEELLADPANETTEMVYQGKACLVHHKELPLGLQVLTVVPTEDIHQLTLDAVKIIEILGLVMIAVAACLTVFFSQTLVYPLRKFAGYMEEGHMEPYPCKKNRRDELGVLYRAFNHLMQILKESTESSIRAMEKEKEAQLRALSAQMNPHFVYNTLNSVSCLAMMKGDEDIADVLTNLTRIMRYNISHMERLVPVSEEIRIIREYEAIQKCCYRSSISFTYDIEPDTLALRIPKLSLQPLVENSMIHGMNFAQNEGKIRICIRKEEGICSFCVWDNGRNAPIEQMNEYVAGKREAVSKGDSLGIRNVYERLFMVYGKEASLLYEKDKEGYTMAVIRIPAVDSIAVEES